MVVLILVDLLLLVYFVVLIASSFKSLSRDINYQHLLNEHESEEDCANYMSYLTFTWLKPIMMRGYLKKIEIINDLSKLPMDLNVNKVSGYFMQKYSNSEQQSNPIINPELLLNQQTCQALLSDIVHFNQNKMSLGWTLTNLRPNKLTFVWS